MIFRITMKDPDGVYESIDEAAKQGVTFASMLDVHEKGSFIDRRREKLREICEKWFEYGEYLEVEVDTDKGTCVVIPKR